MNKERITAIFSKRTLVIGLAWIAGLVMAGIIISIINNSTPEDARTGSASASLMGLLQAGKNNQQQRTDTLCSLTEGPDNACLGAPQPLCGKDLETARIAWKYFENNYNAKTGLVNSVNKYQSTTMWDTGSALAATITAHDLGFIDDKEFDERIQAMFKTLITMELFNKEAPNKVYHTGTGEMVDYRNQPTPDGIGVSALDLARIVSWLNTLSCMHPRFAYPSQKVIERWDMTRLLRKGQMYGLWRDPVSKEIKVVQEGRLGYEQYAGKIFRELGYDQHVSAVYRNKFFASVNIYDIPIAYDKRDPRDLGAYNYVVTESYAMDAVENGLDEENRMLLGNIYEVQKRRWEKTGIVTAVSEDNIDQKPYFLYNTIFTAGLPWNTTTDKGVRYDHLKTTSTKAALSMALLYPNDPYSKVLAYTVGSAYDPEQGWYSGIYENGGGYNKAITANTNGIIMSLMLYKKYGEFYPSCKRCKRSLATEISQPETCNVCQSE